MFCYEARKPVRADINLAAGTCTKQCNRLVVLVLEAEGMCVSVACITCRADMVDRLRDVAGTGCMRRILSEYVTTMHARWDVHRILCV